MFKEVSITKLKISKLKCVYFVSLILLNTINVPLLNFSGWPVNNNFQMLISIFLLYKLFIKEENKINENYFKFSLLLLYFCSYLILLNTKILTISLVTRLI